MKKHCHEEFVVIETDAVGHPGTVMVHLQDALVALWTMVAPFRLGPKTPLANAHAACEFLALHGSFYSCEGLRVAVMWVLLLELLLCDYCSLNCAQILQILVWSLLRHANLHLYHFVREDLKVVLLCPRLAISAVFIVIGQNQVALFITTLICWWISRRKVPLFFFMKVAWIGLYGPENCNEELGCAETEKSCIADRILLLGLHLFFIVDPVRFKWHVAVVFSYAWIQVELKHKTRQIVNEIHIIDCKKCSRDGMPLTSE